MADSGLHRGYYFIAANLMATILIGVATQKWGAEVPDWLFVGLCLIPVLLWLAWLWTHPKVKEYRWLIYTYPRMSLALMVLVGAVVGGLMSALLWWAAQREQRARAPKVAQDDRSQQVSVQETPATQPAIRDVKVVIHRSSVGNPSGDKNSSILHFWLTLRNLNEAPLFIRRWKLMLKMPGREPLIVPTTRMMHDGKVQYDNRTVIAPFNSQDLTDRVDAITKEHPAVGILNFRIDGVSRDELQRNRKTIDLILIFWDDQDVQAELPPYVLGEQETEPMHSPGFKEKILPKKTAGKTSRAHARKRGRR